MNIRLHELHACDFSNYCTLTEPVFLAVFEELVADCWLCVFVMCTSSAGSGRMAHAHAISIDCRHGRKRFQLGDGAAEC